MNQHVIDFIKEIGTRFTQKYIHSEIDYDFYMSKVEQYNESLNNECKLSLYLSHKKYLEIMNND